MVFNACCLLHQNLKLMHEPDRGIPENTIHQLMGPHLSTTLLRASERLCLSQSQAGRQREAWLAFAACWAPLIHLLKPSGVSHQASQGPWTAPEPTGKAGRNKALTQSQGTGFRELTLQHEQLEQPSCPKPGCSLACCHNCPAMEAGTLHRAPTVQKSHTVCESRNSQRKHF